ncbi:MAG TPA: 30S ribosome-binding factor RbfA [Rhizomicrobium sp.]|nr:30S ribosome-binding factor RbfA [Rhizomicrobium sp.]
MPRRPPSRSSSRRPVRGGHAQAGPSQRQLRVGEALRHALAEVLNRNEIRDPDLDGVSVTITQVKPSPDMRYATVYCEPLGGENAKAVVSALNRHKGFLRGEMGHRITMKFTPELRFVEDESFAEAQKIEDILKSPAVQRDLAATDENEDSDD